MLRYLSLAVFLVSLLLPALSQFCHAQVVPQECLAIPPVGEGGQSPLSTDAIEQEIVRGTWVRPHAGDTVALPDGTKQTWTRITPDKDGVWRNALLQGGYAYVSVSSPTSQVMVLEASSHSMVYVNGEPRTGDVYGSGYTRLPVLLHAGINDLLFRNGRDGELHVRLIPAASDGLLDTRDPTLPDLIAGVSETLPGAVIVMNATNQPLTGLSLRVQRPGTAAVVMPLPSLLPLATRKVGFPISGRAPQKPGTVSLTLTLLQTGGGHKRVFDTTKIDLRVRQPGETYKRTFLSAIDGSVQYYAVNPAHPLPGDTGPRALFLTLHGAGVEAIGQADAYESKSWGDIIAPTNRRPYGFDWEDWGRLDAMEVLDLAVSRFKPDPHRVYLTGHSMGGHGTWQVGVQFPDRFAAIGPSAGWISFTSYARAKTPENASPCAVLLARTSLPSDTLALEHNYAQEGVYILHGGADDNVPVTEARTMQKQLAAFHHDFIYYEQPGAGHWWDVSDEPGADCVDWAAMFDFFARHALPDEASVRQVDFVTADPGVSARCHWVTIESQIHRLQLSSVSLRFDPGKRRFVGTTQNVACLTLSLERVSPNGLLLIDLDGQKIDNITYPSSQRLTLSHLGDHWAVSVPLSASFQNPQRSGPFKQAFRNHMLFVYGTQGTGQENAWALAKARYDAEQFWYRGNGSIDIVADTAFNPNTDLDRSIILYGSADTNAAWNPLLADSPVQVHRGQIRVGSHQFIGDDLACLFIRPRPKSDRASVGVVTGSGLVGMRLTDRQPYFGPGIGFPDCLVMGADALTKGVDGVLLAGFFGPDWGVDDGEFALSK